MYETINSPINYGGLELKNRIIFAPTTFGLAEDEYFEKIRKIAAGGCAMVIIGDVPVGKSQFEKSLFDKKGFAHYQKLVEIVHSYDCRICAQLHQTDSNMLAMLKYVPGVLTKKISMEELRPLLNAEVAPYISKLSTRKIHKIINGFTFLIIEPLLIAGIIYFIITFVLSKGIAVLERRMKASD